MPCPNSNRKRSATKAFRCTPETSERIELLAKCAGVTQQEYITLMVEGGPIPINPDIRTYKMLRDDMRKIYQELCRIRPGGNMDEQLVAKVELLAELFVGIAVEEPGVLDLEDAMIDEMERG